MDFVPSCLTRKKGGVSSILTSNLVAVHAADSHVSGYELSGCFWLFASKFWEMGGIYEWYFVILWMQT